MELLYWASLVLAAVFVGAWAGRHLKRWRLYLELRDYPVALISAYDKTGIVEFAQELVNLGWKIISSGGTAERLRKAGVPVIDVAEFVGGKAILGHKVVTLSRELHASELADYRRELSEMRRLKLPFVDLVCVDPYPVEKVAEQPDFTAADVRLLTDIGGPAMLRSAEKGERFVIPNVELRQVVLDYLRRRQPTSRRKGAVASWIRNPTRETQIFKLDLAVVTEEFCGGYSLKVAELLREARSRTGAPSSAL